MKLKNQKEEYLESDLNKAFHFLELKASHNYLIGSNNIRNMLYANDYDLNANLKTGDSITVLHKLYEEFLHIFTTAYNDPKYYILDFKCGIYNNEPIRWLYDDMKIGFIVMDNHRFTFEECLLMDEPEAVVKLDMCYIHNNIFTDINCLYNLHIIQSKKSKESAQETVTKLKEDIQSLYEEGNLFKVIKRYFSLLVIEHKLNDKIMELINSDFGMFYKFISFLDMVVIMLEQKFKPIPRKLININLEYIKQFGSHITLFDVDFLLDKLVKCIKSKKLKTSLSTLIDECKKYLNQMIHNHVDTDDPDVFYTGGKINTDTLYKITQNGYSKDPKKTSKIDGYVLDKELSGERAQVYYHPDKEHLVINHRGTSGIHDMVTDVKMMFGYKDNKRFDHGREITDKAIKKYDTDNITITAHSLGSQIAQNANAKHNAEQIVVNPAVLPQDIVRKQKKNETVIRSQLDPISVLHTLNPFASKKNTITVGATSINPLTEHNSNVLNRLDQSQVGTK
jgi:hypothetical protein